VASRRAVAKLRLVLGIVKYTTARSIIADLCEEHDVTRDDIIGPNLSRTLTKIRTQGYMRCQSETDLSNLKIAYAFGRSAANMVTKAIDRFNRQATPKPLHKDG
jgi:chromosomal replication initiation ATPase DnaA